MSTHVSAPTARWPAAAGPVPERPPRGAVAGARSTPWRAYLALALASVALGSVSLLYPSTPTYDPWGWLLWGREILHLKLNTAGANSFKPFPVLFTVPFALFGKAQPDLWLAVARAGGIFALAMAFKLAARVTVWFGAGPAGRQGLARVIAYGPATLAGAVAAFTMLISPQYVRDAALGYSECLGAGLVLLAVDRHLDDKPRQAFLIGFFPALDRPEIWAFWGLYGLYLWRRDPRARKLIMALFALLPVLWFVPELLGSGHLFRGVTRALHPRPGAPTFTHCPFCTEMQAASRLSISRVKILAGALALGGAIAIWRALRRRRADVGAAVREQAHRPEGIVLVLGVAAIIWFLEISAMTQMGFSGNHRYLIIGGALVVVVGGAGWGLVAWKLGDLLGRWLRPASGAVLALVAVAAVFVFFPGRVGARFYASNLDRALRYQAELRQDVQAVISRAGGAKKVLACGKVETEIYEAQMVAWYLDVPFVPASDAPPGQIARIPARLDPNVILQARDTGGALLRPVVPTAFRYTRVRQRTFRLYEHCR